MAKLVASTAESLQILATKVFPGPIEIAQLAGKNLGELIEGERDIEPGFKPRRDDAAARALGKHQTREQKIRVDFKLHFLLRRMRTS